MKTETKKYTSLEQEVIVCIKIEGHEYDNHPTMTSLDISENTGIPMKKLRGVLSSLEQKGVISEEEFPECMVWMLTL